MLPAQLSHQNTLQQPSSLQSALQMTPNEHLQLQQQPPQQQQQPPIQTPPNQRKRKKQDPNGENDSQSPSEPRRLRRSHEACARCRSKKIKCDSKHPRCTACATAGTVCNQEDRYNRILTPRGYTDRIKHQLAQCTALLKRYHPGFAVENLDEILSREGIEIQPEAEYQVSNPMTFRTDPNAPQQLPKSYTPMYPAPPPPHIVHSYPPHILPYGPPPPGFHHHMQMQPPPGAYAPQMHHPVFPQQPPGAPFSIQPLPPHQQPIPPQQPQSQPPQQQVPATAPPAPVVAMQSNPPQVRPPAQRLPPAKGTDPNGNDMSNTVALAKNFGVSPAIVETLGPGAFDKEDLAVGSNGLSSGRDLLIGEGLNPRNSTNWVSVSVRRSSNASSHAPILDLHAPKMVPSIDIWLPRDRQMVYNIVDVYFTRLNVHRPVFARKDFEKILNDLYDGQTVLHDPGYICSVYLVLALGTLSELNHRAATADIDHKVESPHYGMSLAKKLMPLEWPEHDEFFERALAVKPELRVTPSSLQALILLHWYLYTERQGRTLWRLVGSLVRLSIELGLHHDPTTQFLPVTVVQSPPLPPQKIFTEEECQLRIRLWGIVLLHDRGTSILLGRPLAISPSDTNTPRPCRSKLHPSDFSEHFELSHPIAEIQADIINSLYTPKKQAGDTIMRNATRIIKSMLEFRRGLPDRYKLYFSGTTDWPIEKRVKLVQEITEDEGLTLLKIGIARILLLRALFNSKELSYSQRHRALIDAIITSHNTIIVHKQLIRFPDIAFFTSPIPLHIAAMVILYGHMSKCEVLPRQVALEDIALALDMLPRFRWRWERKDVAGGHPLIARLAERVMEADLHSIDPPRNPVLFSEPDWDDDSPLSPGVKSQQSTPTMSTVSYNTTPVYGPQPMIVTTPTHPVAVHHGAMNPPSAGSNSGGSTPPDKHLADVPAALFYPFFPEHQGFSNMSGAPANGAAGTSHQKDYGMILAAAVQDATYGISSPNSYMSEERDVVPHQAQGNMSWTLGSVVYNRAAQQPQPPQQQRS